MFADFFIKCTLLLLFYSDALYYFPQISHLLLLSKYEYLISGDHLEQGLPNFSCKRPDSKWYFMVGIYMPYMWVEVFHWDNKGACALYAPLYLFTLLWHQMCLETADQMCPAYMLHTWWIPRTVCGVGNVGNCTINCFKETLCCLFPQKFIAYILFERKL